MRANGRACRLDFNYQLSGICIREHQITNAIKSVDTQFPAKTRRRRHDAGVASARARAEKIGGEISENVDEVGRHDGCRREAGQDSGMEGRYRSRSTSPVVTARKAKKKKLPIYKPLAENEV